MNDVTIDHVCEALSARTGLPADHLRSGRIAIDDPQALRTRLREAIVGQDEAIEVSVRAVTRRSRLDPRAGERRPLWTALFTGPSGVGKSQLAKELTRTLFGDADRHLVQIDLSDFRDAHTIARLVGAPPGYTGHGDGGELTNALRRVPTGVLLLDEVEKAHADVVTQVLIPALGEGVVHDMNNGQLLDISQYIVLMTSNLGAGQVPGTQLGLGGDTDADPERRVRSTVASFLPNEIRGRIDDEIVFRQLTDEAARQIWDREVAVLSARMSTVHQPIDIHVENDVWQGLIENARVRIKDQGARAVRGLFDRVIVDHCLDLVRGLDGPGRLEVTSTGNGDLRFRLHPLP
jgi:ATP-dependent Clp protease ATP-binding subunit ClpC